jgi:light-regulated signal transduction histidine kinase (bacteriophytochrome)
MTCCQPLQVIQSAYEWLGARTSLASEKARIERGERAIARLTEQLDRLVAALRLYEQTRTIEVSPVALAHSFWRIAAENHDTAADKGVELRVSQTAAAVMSNAVLLDSVLLNLVRNAVKYTEPGGAACMARSALHSRRICRGCRAGSHARAAPADGRTFAGTAGSSRAARTSLDRRAAGRGGGDPRRGPLDHQSA